jgi:hypothetical protein
MNNQSIRFTVDDITLTPGGTATINKEHVYYDVDTGKYFLEISGT